MHRVAVFASGNGTNVEEIFKYFEGNRSIEIALLLCNNPKAGVIQRAETRGMPLIIFDKKDLVSSSHVLDKLEKDKISWIIQEKY